MKNRVTIFFFLFAMFLIINQVTYSQTRSNPFDVKTKKSKGTKQVGNPQVINNLSSIITTPVQSRQLPNANYKTMNGLNNFRLNALTRNFDNVQFNARGQVNFINGSLTKKSFLDVNSPQSVKNASIEYLSAVKRQMRISNPENEFEIYKVETDKLNQTHIRLQQTYLGVPVYASEIILHATNGEINVFNGTYYPTPRLASVTPSVAVDNALSAVNQDISTFTTLKTFNQFEQQLLNYSAPKSELVVYYKDRDISKEHLVWHFTVRPNLIDRWEYFVDAKTGDIVHKYYNTQSDGPQNATGTDLNGASRSFSTYLMQGTYFMIDATKSMYNPQQSQLPDNPVGAIWTIDANNTYVSNVSHVTSSNNSNWSPTAVSAHYSTSLAFDYHKNTHNRNSINNQGGTILSIINVAEEGGGSMENAFWNGQFACYGNGGSMFKPLAGSLDVIAHELGHGIVSNSANLEYQDQSGALNETFADIFGAMADRDDWHIGEDIMKPNSYFPSGYLRDMSNPHNGGNNGDAAWQPANVSEMYTGNQDNGGVHTNSGIVNFCYYNYATAITKEKAEKVFYRALTVYLTRSSQFIDGRNATIQAATDLYGASSNEVTQAKNCFAQVGIGEGSSEVHTTELGVNPGDDFILSYNTNETEPSTLYTSSTTGTNFNALTTTVLKRKPSITDDGSATVYIDNESIMKVMFMSPVTEQVLQEAPVWDNVAVSKDGKLIAAITTSIDSAIWVFDYVAGWKKFHLYNPTFTTGEATQNVLYADAIEFDYTGQYIVYDAYNELTNSNGENIDYWDIGMIKVWDNGANTWAAGEIGKLFSTLPEGVSIGNPSLSKNSPHIMAFDYFDTNDTTTYILGANIETSDLGMIYFNDELSYPCYSKLDDKIVYNNYDNQLEMQVSVLGLTADKINWNQQAPTAIIPQAKWPVWFAVGTRTLPDNVNSLINSTFTTSPNPTSSVINLKFESKANETVTISICNLLGQELKQISKKYSTEGVQNEQISIADLQQNTYILKLKIGTQIITKKIVKM